MWRPVCGNVVWPCILSQTDGSLQVDPGLGVEVGGGRVACLAGSSVPEGLVGGGWGLCAEIFDSGAVVLNLGCALESPGEV